MAEALYLHATHITDIYNAREHLADLATHLAFIIPEPGPVAGRPQRQTRRWERLPASRPRLAEPTFGLARAAGTPLPSTSTLLGAALIALSLIRLAMLGTDVDAGHGDGEQRGMRVTLIAGGPWPSTSGAQLGWLTSGPHEPLRGIGGGVG